MRLGMMRFCASWGTRPTSAVTALLQPSSIAPSKSGVCTRTTSVPASSCGTLALDIGEIAGKILAARLDQRRRAHADQLRLGAVFQIEDRFLEIIGATEHGRHFVHGGGLQRNRLLEVAHEQHHREGRAALAAVKQRHGGIDAEKGKGGAERLRGLQRIDRRRLLNGCDRRHRRVLSTPPCRSRRRRRTSCGDERGNGRRDSSAGIRRLGRGSPPDQMPIGIPRRRLAHLLPDRIVNGQGDAFDQLDHAVIAGIGENALLVDVEPGHLRLQAR